MSSDVRSTIGAALAGCMTAVGLSAILGFQTFLYFQIFPSDALRYKALVAWIWVTDATHTILICTAVWQYAIENFNNPEIVHKIFPALAITVAITAIITLSVNVFYGWRIHKMSKQNWWLTGPIAFLCIARIGLAFTTTAEMILMKTFPEFAARFKILFTSGLAVSAVTDIIVSASRYYYLRNLKQGYSMTQEVVDAVVVFTINDGCLTCAVVIASIACWLRMPGNFIYLGIYFTIAKFYSNSVLATLNLRNWYRHRHAWPVPNSMSIPMRPQGINGVHSNNSPHTKRPGTSSDDKRAPEDIHGTAARMEVFVDHQIEYNVGDFAFQDLDGDTGSLSKTTSPL
ncbi:hypothetical protein B0H17DRAFT_1194755 [Mycena rosella]|uniref:DUF6534 domain-containing protein n=1 Tax=Mycena rosella TaxID=1033263 RepID=A0AAD7E023_MYCRO|nr:hypothetical protein B0H17DRAFT_1194755 [Mycena rosella]